MTPYPGIGASILTGLGGQGLSLIDRGFSRVQDAMDRERMYHEQKMAEERQRKAQEEAQDDLFEQQLLNMGIGVGAGALTGGLLAAPFAAGGGAAAGLGAAGANAAGTTTASALTAAGVNPIAAGAAGLNTAAMTGGTAGLTAGGGAALGAGAGGAMGSLGDFSNVDPAVLESNFNDTLAKQASVENTLLNTPIDLSSSSTNLPASNLNPGLNGLENTTRSLSTPAGYNAGGGNVQGQNLFGSVPPSGGGGNSVLRGALLGGLTGGLTSSGIPGLANVGAMISANSPDLNPLLASRIAANNALIPGRLSQYDVNQARVGNINAQTQTEDALRDPRVNSTNALTTQRNASALQSLSGRDYNQARTTTENDLRQPRVDATMAQARQRNTAADTNVSRGEFYGARTQTENDLRVPRRAATVAQADQRQSSAEANRARADYSRAQAANEQAGTGGSSGGVKGEFGSLLQEYERRAGADPADPTLGLIEQRLNVLAQNAPDSIDPDAALRVLASPTAQELLQPETIESLKGIAQRGITPPPRQSLSTLLNQRRPQQTVASPQGGVTGIISGQAAGGGGAAALADRILNMSPEEARTAIEAAAQNGDITQDEYEELMSLNG